MNSPQGSRLDRFLAPWVFVLTGILFNILSAVITHYFIGLNNDKIGVIDLEIDSKQVLIDSLWQSKTEVDRKQEFFILLLAGKTDMPKLNETLYRDYLTGLVDTHHLGDYRERIAASGGDLVLERSWDQDLDVLLEISHTAQLAIIESINETYLESLELREARRPLERANSRLFSIAIFLQVIGLILVLARDLRRH